MLPQRRRYENTLTPIEPRPLLAQWPQFVQPVVSRARFEAPMLVDDGEEAEISVRAWRWSYNGAPVRAVPFLACDWRYRTLITGSAHPLAACAWHSAGHNRAPEPAQSGADCSHCGSSMVTPYPSAMPKQLPPQLRRWIEWNR